jgi:hypothetical protein
MVHGIATHGNNNDNISTGTDTGLPETDTFWLKVNSWNGIGIGRGVELFKRGLWYGTRHGEGINGYI